MWYRRYDCLKIMLFLKNLKYCNHFKMQNRIAVENYVTHFLMKCMDFNFKVKFVLTVQFLAIKNT